MSYITVDDLKTRFGEDELLQLAPADNDELNTSRVESAIADAESEIDSLLVTRFVTPLSPVPAIVPRLTADIARYFLHDDQATDEARQRYEDALQVLKEIASGERNPEPRPAEQTNAPQSAGVSVSRTKADRLFTRETLKGY